MENINDGSFTAEKLTGAQYLRKVNELLSGRYGVSYSADELWRDVHGCAPGSEMAKLRKSFVDGEPPEAFVRTLAADAGLRPIDQMPGASHEAARAYNRMKAALVGYANESKLYPEGSQWELGVDGTIFLQGAGGVAKMEPRQTDRGWDYMVSESPGGLLDNTGAGALLDLVGDFEIVATGPDIGDAYDNFIKARPDYAPGGREEEDAYRPRP
jgi:hypothetical protein